MNPHVIQSLMSSDLPWSFGLRSTIVESKSIVESFPVEEYPFFAAIGEHGSQFRAIGADLEECIASCARRPVASEPLPETSISFVNPPQK